jgi:Uma2 family endonuclease
MTSIVASPSASSRFATIADSEGIPPLENGDQLTLHEFMRRYEAMPELNRAELIEGIVYMGAAVRVTHHGRPHGWLGNIITTYGMQTGLDFADNATIELDPDNAPQPDLFMYLPVELGGSAKINEKGYLDGPPDFIAEIAASSVSIDLHGKLRAYQKNGVREYVVWRVIDAAVDWFVLENDQFLPLAADENGVYHSRVLPGLWLHVPALLRRDAEQLWATLDSGMATAEYREFADRVKAALNKPASS